MAWVCSDHSPSQFRICAMGLFCCKQRAAPLLRARIASQLSLLCGCTEPIVRPPLPTILDLQAGLLSYSLPPKGRNAAMLHLAPCPFLHLTHSTSLGLKAETGYWCGSGALVTWGKSLRERGHGMCTSLMAPWGPGGLQLASATQQPLCAEPAPICISPYRSVASCSPMASKHGRSG